MLTGGIDVKKRVLTALLLASLLLVTIMPAAARADDKYDLSNFGYRYVDSKGRGSLVFQKSPRGKSMKGHKFYTGDRIYVNIHWRQDGYAIAYENGEYGYVDASYIDWSKGSGGGKPGGGSQGGGKPGGGSQGGGKPSGGGSWSGGGDRDLSNFEYRRVASNGRGSLVFQKEPRGKSMPGHKFYDGDWIYVNIHYRRDGYSIAYENGEYGYVDASYIDWNSRKGGGSGGSRVHLTGNVNVRTGPGLDYSIIGTAYRGDSLRYVGDTSTDYRGVAWYYVYFNGGTGWVSSRYAYLG